MGHFETTISTMQKAVNDINTAKAAINKQIVSIGGTAEGTIKSWQGAGGDTLRALMVRYDNSARALQTAIATFEAMVDEQARTYGINDTDQSTLLTQAGGNLQMA